MGLRPPWVPEGQNPSVGRGQEGNLVHPAPALREKWPPDRLQRPRSLRVGSHLWGSTSLPLPGPSS